jgi:cytidyltransferase-like protein
VYTAGAFDLFHVGLLDFLEQVKKEGDYLIVGLHTDPVNFSNRYFLIFYTKWYFHILIQTIKGGQSLQGLKLSDYERARTLPQRPSLPSTFLS